MRFTRNSIASKACVAGLTLATALAMVPTAAFGADLNGNTGNITISGLVDGDQVTAYQILNRHYDADTNNVTDTFMKGTGYTLEDFQKITSDNGTYVKGSEMQVAADKIASAIKGGASPISTLPSATAANGTVTFKDAPAGEWLILVTGQDGTTRVYQNTIVSNAPEANTATGKYEAKDATATIKYSEETVHKGIGTTKEDAEDDSKKTADGLYGIGDLVPFVISTTVPNYPANSTQVKFVIGDTPSAGLAIQKDATNPITVTVNGTAVDATADDGSTNYTLSLSNGVLTITFDPAYILKHTGESVLVNYKAKVTSDAKVTATDTTHNSATITFNTNPYEESESKPGDENKVKTYGLFFVKTDGKTALKGATFQIKYKDGDKAGQYVLGDDGKPLSCTTQDDGIVWFEDLAAGTYTLVETHAPTGYQAVKDFDVTITAGTGANADNPATPDVTEANYVQYNAKDGVPDPKVGMLPTTGDAGTIGLTAAGICLVAGSAFVIASRARRSKDDQE